MFVINIDQTHTHALTQTYMHAHTHTVYARSRSLAQQNNMSATHMNRSRTQLINVCGGHTFCAHTHTSSTPPPPGLPGVLELDEGERRPAPVLQVDERHLAELVEQILDVLGANVRRQIAHVDAALVAAAVRHVGGFRMGGVRTFGDGGGSNELCGFRACVRVACYAFVVCFVVYTHGATIFADDDSGQTRAMRLLR